MAIVQEIPDETSAASSSARQRRNQPNTSRIPLVHPSTLPPSSAPPLISPPTTPSGSERSVSPTPSEIDELLRNGALPIPIKLDAPDREKDVWDEVFDTAILTIPFSSLYLMLDILVYMQYSFKPKYEELFGHMARAIPTLATITWYTNKYASHPITTPALMATSLLSGGRLIWLMNKASWGVVTAQAPAMGALWTLTIVQLPLSRAVLCLAGVAGWVWYTGLRLQT